MEKLKVKHDHKLTDILKVGIFAIFLLQPFFTYAPTALYYGVNEYATNNTTTNVDIQYKYQSNEVNSLNDLIQGNIYEYNCNDLSIEDLFGQDDFLSFYLLNDLYLDDSASLSDIDFANSIIPNTFIYIYFDGASSYIDLYNSSVQYELNQYFIEIEYNSSFLNNCIIQYYDSSFSNVSRYSAFSYTNYNEIESVDIQENVEQTISQQMYNSWQTMWETPMYSWTNNSILKTGLDNFTSVFGVNNQSYITNLITYELIIVTIYIVIDIVLTLFKWLTHMVGSKE